MRIMLNHIFQDKDKWKEDTFNLIKNELLSVKNNRFVRYNQSSSTHLVCVYGKSQVGKTTLILNMIGLKEEWKKEVSDVLRGGVTRGNSSTSTAIIYSQNVSDITSESGKYGLRIETVDSSVESSSFEYFNSDEMKCRLQVIRDKVENNEFSTETILHISIPYKYFSSSVGHNKISILDLPGVESRNKKERAHVESLMTRYIPLSSVCIIACPANVIQSLENEEISKNIDWKKCPHKFLLVLTNSYSDGSIKSYFNTPRKQRTVPFENFVKDRYQVELTKVVGNNKIEVFPLDLGDSFERLLSDEICDSEDCEEIRSTRDSILSALQVSIVQHKGEQLISTIKELRVIVEQLDQQKIALLKEKKKDVEEEMDANGHKGKKYQDKLDCYQRQLEEIQGDRDLLCERRKEIETLSRVASTITQTIVSSVRNDIVSRKLSKDGCLNDPQKICLATISNNLTASIDKQATSKAMSLMRKCDLPVDLYSSKIVNSIYYKFTKMYEDKMYPQPSGFIQRVFGNTPKITLVDFYRALQNIEQIIREEIRSLIISQCFCHIDKKNNDYQDNIGMLKRHIKSYKDKIQSLKDSDDTLKEKIQGIYDEIEIVESQKERDKQTLNQYLEYCEIAYLCQRDGIIEKVNSSISKEERFIHMLFLGVIDKEYNVILNTSNE